MALAIVLGALAQTTGDGDGDSKSAPTALPTRTPGPAEATAQLRDPTFGVLQPAPDPARLERAEVVDIIDGDTIDVRIPSLRSGQATREERVRYYGVDTTERGEDCFSEATDRNEELAGDTVLLLPDARERDRFGRLLRYVFDDAGRSIDALLIGEGLGHAWPEDGTYRDQLLALEGHAQAAGFGCLWQ
jgi:endonuclease YncB( thermonuclease family)